VRHQDALALLRDAVGHSAGAWADLGCGTGTFTRALADILGSQSRIIAVDQDAGALDELRLWAERHAPGVVAVRADFARPSEILELRDGSLAGLLFANSLHFVRDADAVLASLVRMLRPAARGAPGGRVVLVEYDLRDANPWVPYPISRDRLPALAMNAGLSVPVVTATRRSRYQGLMYAAAAERTLGRETLRMSSTCGA
jgi:ubiquinone/menaquinone biosynthesis C-methylase UbiE